MEEEIDNAKSSVVRYANYSKLQRMALMVIAHKSTSEEIGILRKLFQQYDTKRDGQLSFEEFKAAIQEAGYTEEDYRSIFDAVVRCSQFSTMHFRRLTHHFVIGS